MSREDVTRRCHEKMSREIVRNCHEKLSQNSRSDYMCFRVSFFCLMTKDRRGLWVSRRSQSAECKCKKLLWQECFRFDELYGAMFLLQKSSITTPCHSFVRKWSRNVFLLKLETGIETYYIIWSHVSTSSHVINTFQWTLFWDANDNFPKSHSKRGKKPWWKSPNTRQNV